VLVSRVCGDISRQDSSSGFETERRTAVVALGYPVSTPDACVRTSVDPCVPFATVSNICDTTFFSCVTARDVSRSWCERGKQDVESVLL